MSRPLVATALLAATFAGTSARGQDPRPAPTFDEIIRMKVVFAVPGMDRVGVRRNLVYRTVGTTELTMDAYAPTGTTVETFVKEALTAGMPLELLDHPAGRHGFDILDDDARSREILARTFDFLKTHLR